MLAAQFYYAVCLTLVDLMLPASAAPLPPPANKHTPHLLVSPFDSLRAPRSTFSATFIQQYVETTDIPTATEHEGTEDLDNIEWTFSPLEQAAAQHAYTGHLQLTSTQAQTGHLHGPLTEAPAVPQHGPLTEAPATQQYGSHTEAPAAPQHGPNTEAPAAPQHGPLTEASAVPQHGPLTEAPAAPQHGSHTEAPAAPQHGPQTEAPAAPQHGSHTEAPAAPQHGPQTEAPATPQHGPHTEAPAVPQHGPQTEAPATPQHGSHTEAPAVPQHGTHTEAPAIPQNQPGTHQHPQPTRKSSDHTTTHARSKAMSIMKLNKAPERHSHTPTATVHSVQKPARSWAEIQRLTNWLEDFGYLEEPSSSGAAQSPEVRINAALRKLQRYADIPVTGEADNATMALLDKPRCGEKDFQPVMSRHKRYILLNRRWERGREIDIQFKNYTTSMTIDMQERIMQQVIDQWNAAADARLVFHPRGENVEFPEINIHHTRYDNKGRPFGPYGVLAYAALPRNGDMYFDETERWAEYHHRYPYTFSYKSVALHELGHSLGLAHSNNPSAVMYAFYGPNRHTLTPDDIAGAVALFGPN